MRKRKAQRRNNIHMADAEQKLALAQFQKDFTKALPQITALGQTAKAVHQSMVDAPFWRVVDAPKPEGAEEPEMWSVGHAKVNYVDHIEHEGAQPK